MFRKTTPEELTLLASAPEWTREWTGDCTHAEVHVYESDGTVECSNCGICLPTPGTAWAS